jgi:TonB family protein
MRKTTCSSLLFAGALAFAAGDFGNNAYAQDANQEKKVVVNTFGDNGATIPQNPSQSLIMPFPLGAIQSRLRVGNVKNAPFSGEIVCESTQTLADGNRIVHRTNTIVYRDSQGRTRQETSFKIRDANSGGYKEHITIQISDPVSGQSITLNPQNRTAHKFAQRSFIEPRLVRGLPGVSVGGGLPDVSAVGAPNRAAIALGDFGGPARRPVGRFDADAEVKSESLGTQTVEGVEAEGTRIIRTIPAGSMGNERPIEITYERWYSQELQLDILIKSVDPRAGESAQQLTNINRGEPDASLFEAPPDYTVQEFKSSAMGLDVANGANLLSERMRNPVWGSDDRAAGGAVYAMTASLRPTILYREKAKYTEEARRNRVHGTVVLNVVFGADGSINSIRVLRGLPDGLTEKAVEAALKTRFQPAVKNGTPVSVRGSMEFTFVLDK